MNRTGILNRKGDERKQYIREGLGGMSIQKLKHIASQYGVHDSLRMNRGELECVIIEGLNSWAEKFTTLPDYKDTSTYTFPTGTYSQQNQCAIPACKQNIYMGGICNAHWYEFTVTGTQHPEWLSYLIYSQRSFQGSKANTEIVFSYIQSEGEYLV